MFAVAGGWYGPCWDLGYNSKTIYWSISHWFIQEKMSDPGAPALNKEMTGESLKKEAISSPDPHVRGYSIYLLGAEKDPSRKEIFLSALRDENKGVRAQAAQALAALGEAIIPDLCVLLHNDNWRIRYRAAEALGKIPSRDGVQHLIRAVSDEKDHVRYMAIKSLGSLAEKTAVPDIISRLSDENEYVRRVAVLTLGKIGSEEGIAAVCEIFDRETADSVRRVISKVLKQNNMTPAGDASLQGT